MAPPSRLNIATGVVLRSVKDQASYHKEIELQEARIKQAEGNTSDENAEYTLRQEKQALQETKNVLQTVKANIKQAVERLEEELESGEAPAEEVSKAKEAIAQGRTALRDISS